MKLACKVRGKKAMIVGYASAKRGRVYAVVITEGELRPVRLKDIELLNVPEDLAAIVELKPRVKTKAATNAS